MVTEGRSSGEELERNNEIGGNVVERGRSPSSRSTALASSLSLTGRAIFRCDNQMEDTSSSEIASEDPEFPIASRVRSTGVAMGLWVAAEFIDAIWPSRVSTLL